MAFFHLMSIFTIRDITRGMIGVGVVINCLKALVISIIASKFIFSEILGCCCTRDLAGKGDDEGLLCSRGAELAQLQSPPAQAQVPGNAVVQREEGEEERTLRLG